MKKITTVLLMIFLASCTTSCKLKKKLICAQVKQATVKPLPFYDVSFKFNRCRARCFSMGDWESKPISQCPSLAGMNSIKIKEGKKKIEVIDFPIEYCEGISGPVVEDWAEEIKPKMRALIRMRGTYCE